MKMTFFTQEGSQIDSIQLEVDGVQMEFLTMASVTYLMALERDEIDLMLGTHELITHNHTDMEWLGLWDFIKLLRLTLFH